jgi:hypothetical protein
MDGTPCDLEEWQRKRERVDERSRQNSKPGDAVGEVQRVVYLLEARVDKKRSQSQTDAEDRIVAG